MKRFFKVALILGACLVVMAACKRVEKESASSDVNSKEQATKIITEDEMLAAQQKWGDAIIAIGKAYKQKEDYTKVAQKTIDELYAFDIKDVLFKPTKAREDQFRGTKQEALSYFVQGKVGEDKGFALQPWSKVRFENDKISIDSDSALAMGNYFFTDVNTGDEVKVEYTFGYIKDEHGKLKIHLHHSSLPYGN